MNKPATWLLLLVVGLPMLDAITPTLIALSDALVLLIVVLCIGIVVVRLVYFHTRRW